MINLSPLAALAASLWLGLVSPGFAGYLGGLGLRDSNGVAKEAWEAWRNP